MRSKLNLQKVGLKAKILKTLRLTALNLMQRSKKSKTVRSMLLSPLLYLPERSVTTESSQSGGELITNSAMNASSNTRSQDQLQERRFSAMTNSYKLVLTEQSFVSVKISEENIASLLLI